MSLVDVERLREIAEVEFADIVVEAWVPDLNELRVILIDSSFMDVWFSLKLQDRYSFHWERRAIDGTIYRHDNAPHRRWQAVATFPCHFHNRSETDVSESYLSEVLEDALREFLAFARDRMSTSSAEQSGGDTDEIWSLYRPVSWLTSEVGVKIEAEFGLSG